MVAECGKHMCFREGMRMNKQEIEENIAILKSMIPEYEMRNRMFGVKALRSAISALEHQLTNGWIPVSERLPKIYEGTCTSEIVLVQGYDKEIDYEWQAMGWYAEETKQWYFAECKSTDKPINWINIIAWQPLPEPYKTKED